MKIGWFSTGRDEAARALLTETYDNIQDGYLDKVKIEFVFSNREHGENRQSDLFFNMVERYGLTLLCYSSRKFHPSLRRRGIKGDEEALKSWRTAYDREIMTRLEPYSPSLILLAGYMLILEEEVCKRYIIINLHPSPPGGPQGSWQEVIWTLIKQQKPTAGGMIHIVTEELDRGPPITYFTFPIREGKFLPLWQNMRAKNLKEAFTTPLFKEIRKEEVKREYPLIIETLRLISTRAITLQDRTVYSEGRRVKEGILLNKVVEE